MVSYMHIDRTSAKYMESINQISSTQSRFQCSSKCDGLIGCIVDWRWTISPCRILSSRGSYTIVAEEIVEVVIAEVLIFWLITYIHHSHSLTATPSMDPLSAHTSHHQFYTSHAPFIAPLIARMVADPSIQRLHYLSILLVLPGPLLAISNTPSLAHWSIACTIHRSKPRISPWSIAYNTHRAFDCSLILPLHYPVLLRLLTDQSFAPSLPHLLHDLSLALSSAPSLAHWSMAWAIHSFITSSLINRLLSMNMFLLMCFLNNYLCVYVSLYVFTYLYLYVYICWIIYLCVYESIYVCSYIYL